MGTIKKSLSVVTSAATILTLAGLAQGQPQQQDDVTEVRPRSGVRVNGLSGYAMTLTRLGLDPAGALPWPRTMVIGGGSADVGYRAYGRTSMFGVGYRGSYDWNNQYESFSGFNHAASLSVNAGQGNRVSFSFAGIAEQRRLSNMLFEQLTGLTATRSRSVTDLSNTLGDLRATGTALEPALDFWLFGQSQRRAAARTTITYAQSRRLSWYGNAGAERAFPITGENNAAPRGFAYSGVTMGSGGGGFQYALSPRTSIGGSADYVRTYAGAVRTAATTAGMNVTRVITEHWIGYAAGGYAQMREPHATNLAPVRSYFASAGLGALKGSHSVVFLAHRSLSSRYGYLASRTEAGEVAWTYSPFSRAWMAWAAGTYQRLSGFGAPRLQAWTGRFGTTRRLGAGFSFVVEGVLAGLESRVFTASHIGAARLSIVWSPSDLRP